MLARRVSDDCREIHQCGAGAAMHAYGRQSDAIQLSFLIYARVQRRSGSACMRCVRAGGDFDDCIHGLVARRCSARGCGRH